MAIIGTNDTATVRVATPPVGVTYQNIGDAATLNGVAASNYARTDIDEFFGGSPHFLTGFVYNRAPVGQSGHYFIQDENGTSQALLYWNRSNDSVYLNRYSVTATSFEGEISILSDGNIYLNSHLAWHAGNDGAGSGLDADLLDGVQGSSYLRSDASSTYSGGTMRFTNNDGIDIDAGLIGNIGGVEIFQNTANADALILFHTSFDFAGYFGLDGGLNDFVIGGWNFGTTTKYRVWHAGNDVKHRSFTVGTVPSASSSGAGTMIYVSNESGGAVVAFSDGTNWRRVTDRAVIS